MEQHVQLNKATKTLFICLILATVKSPIRNQSTLLLIASLFLFIFVLFKQQFEEKRPQQILNLDCQSGRQDGCPLDHHHCPISQLYLGKCRFWHRALLSKVKIITRFTIQNQSNDSSHHNLISFFQRSRSSSSFAFPRLFCDLACLENSVGPKWFVHYQLVCVYLCVQNVNNWGRVGLGHRCPSNQLV